MKLFDRNICKVKQAGLILGLFATVVLLVATAPLDDKKREMVVLATPYGEMTILLYDETPLHRENFLKLVEASFYDDLLFHRVISGFMVQGGDPDSKGAPANKPLGMGGPGYTIPAEIKPEFIHKKGALAAARQGDQSNPEKASSGSQFYIVHGASVKTEQLRKSKVSYTEEQLAAYAELGGAPHLDAAYTVFGEVIEGLSVVDSIAAQPTGRGNRPVTDIPMTMKIVRKKWK